ncbi:hypothetical protein M2444_006170 [Paenibacillus sp. PastF-3]|uniref:hypothetical protein n=1 Tax=Paenibacillus sp. PastF-3 TaxID=2940626 RepID=UPI0024754D9B|nr:hypothetical protein [Paenibacillus sp. PastF-3]MDH6374320.1 hypothetical protein [Paenibacillus sp. PastF-3]
MRLKIEEWLTSQIVSEEAGNLLKESIVCYKASAYRAGILFSYLFFQTVLKERILSAKKPDDIPVAKWNAIIQNLRNDDKWDEEVYEAVKRGPGSWVIFNLTDDLRQQVTYWKNRRNDCAHAKTNGIHASHVESLWSFIQYNLPKFVVNGGKAALLEKVRVHFDITLTAPNTDFMYITNEIIHSIYEYDYEEFIVELNQLVGEDTFFDSLYGSERKISFWLKLFGLNDAFDKTLIEYLMVNENLNNAILKSDSSKVVYYREHPQFIRKLWFDGKIEPSILAALFRNDLIPFDQQEEAIESIVISYQRVYPEIIQEEDMNVLIARGLPTIFKRIAFVESRISSFEWANHAKRWLVIWYIKKYGVDEIIVWALTNTFRGDHPWHLRDALKEVFNEDPVLKDSFVMISQEKGYILPTLLGF